MDFFQQTIFDLGIVRFVVEIQGEDQARRLVNGIAEAFVEIPVTDVHVFTESDVVNGHFRDSGYDIDWFTILRRDYLQQFDVRNIAEWIQDSMPYNDTNEVFDLIEGYLTSWHINARRAFEKALADNEDLSRNENKVTNS